jgi:multicomponent Na+:H+ antiporter subunit G
MIATALDILSWLLILGGAAFSIVGAIGLLRFPDFYTRLHAAGITDTLGAWMILGGAILQADSWLVAVKIAFIALFLFFTSPTATHALARAALASGLKPWSRTVEKREL